MSRCLLRDIHTGVSITDDKKSVLKPTIIIVEDGMFLERQCEKVLKTAPQSCSSMCLYLFEISFERLLLHAICQYMDLVSASE